MYKDTEKDTFLRRLRKRNKHSMWQSSYFGWHGVRGVYCVCTGGLNYETLEIEKLKVWYVGSSGNVGTRLNNLKHPYRILWGKGFQPFIRYAETEDYKKLEKRIISLLSPPMNKQYNRHR